MRDSRILLEWLDANGNKIKLNNTASTPLQKSGKADFTEKFKKIYSHIKDVWGGLNIMSCAMHTLDIYYGYGQKWYNLIIRYIPTEGCFEINITERKSNKLIFAGEADCWAELLDILLQTETIKNRKLCEWVDAKGNKIALNSSATPSIQTANAAGGYKERFTKLLDYHMKHLPPTATYPEIKLLQDDEFIYEEHHATGDVDNDYDLTVAVAVNKYNDDWDISVYKNGTLVKVDFGNGWKELLLSLRTSLSIPAVATPEYIKLCEWLDSKGNKVQINNRAINSNSEEMVYIWDIYINPKDKGVWRSADRRNGYGEYDGYVYETAKVAKQGGINHLRELKDELYLEGEPEDYTIDVVAIPKSEVSDYTLDFSGL